MGAQGQLIVRRLFEEVFNARAYEVIADLVGDDFVEHAVAPFGVESPGAVAGVAHMRSVVEWLTAQFPDMQMSVEAVISEGDFVAARVRAVGTNLGPFNGFAPPTGRAFDAEQCHWYRVVDGRLAEHWAVRDDLRTMLQLGVLTPPGPR